MLLELKTPIQTVASFDFDRGELPIYLGRSDEADLIIPDRWVSRMHSAIEEDDGHIFVRDLGSRHGTFVNDQLVAKAELCDGDRIDLGLSTLLVRHPR